MFTDGDPALDTTDAKEMLVALVTGQEKMLERMDRDKDGLISFAEFERALLFTSMVDVGGIMGLVEASLSFSCLTDNPPNLPAWISLVSGFTSGAASRAPFTVADDATALVNI